MEIPLLVATNNLSENISESPVRDLGLTISLGMVRRGEAKLGAVYLVEPSPESAVGTETESSIRFASKEDGCTPRGVAGFNETQSQELLKLTLEFGGLGDRESVGCLVVNTIVMHKLDEVLNVAHRWDAGVRERWWENVVVLSNEVTNCGLQVGRIACEFLSVSVDARDDGVDSTDGGGWEVEMGTMEIGGSGSRGMSSASGQGGS
ncbi:hypothetical protein CBR_g17076 [Chara braunii]|uniref:Uncharacterized protein n=1 Tax=Chara braunii TaxID=69332 RepID=A0A388KUK4_CHABU|nr:hypothetical protein CBR_g17076 [Chara braunii]|eukprot:GBG73736.1 hypothetical protein CBR_g17076 [Chara braunii]